MTGRSEFRLLTVALVTLLFLVACDFDAPIKELRYQITVRVEGEFVPGSPMAEIEGVGDLDAAPEIAPGLAVFVSAEFDYDTPYRLDDPAVLLVAAARAVDTDTFTLTVIQTDLHTTPRIVRVLYQRTLGPSDNPTLELNAMVPFPQ
ncbi:MAG: hypothetical protein EA403_07070 [Spirochaetaceae bacterium]|nr:MAG: hypothetical protein EA403_07070 [Spirochaetaceae bacterium]